MPRNCRSMLVAAPVHQVFGLDGANGQAAGCTWGQAGHGADGSNGSDGQPGAQVRW